MAAERSAALPAALRHDRRDRAACADHRARQARERVALRDLRHARVLAIRHVRNQGLYFAALPLLRAADSLQAAVRSQRAALVPIGWAFAHDRIAPASTTSAFRCAPWPR